MELKIVCQCGQKYKFDVEPVNGRMPFTVQCPICHVDGTANANDALSRLAPAPSTSAPKTQFLPSLPTAASSQTAPAPAPVAAPAAMAFQAAAPAPMGGLRINHPAPPPAPAPAPVSDAAAPPPVPVTGGPVRPMPMGSTRPPRIAPAPKVKSAEFSMGRGIGGAVAGTLVGCALMYAFFYFAEFRFPLMGTGVGLLAGLGARWLARGTENTLGIISAAIAGAGLAGTFVLMYGEFPMINIISVVACAVFANRTAS